MKTMPHVLTKWLIALAIGSVVSQSCAQAAEVNAMDAGAIAQKISPPKQLEGQTENLTSETTAPMVRIQVSAWKVTGNSVFDSATLLKVLEPFIGRSLTITELQEPVERLTSFYRERGYLLAQAFLPVQNIDDSGEIWIQILEANWGEIAINNQSNIAESVIAKQIKDLKPGTVIHRDAVELASMYLADLPGINAQMKVRSGRSWGSSDLQIDIQPSEPSAGDFNVDNHGNAYTGRNRFGLYQQFFNPFGQGDSASMHVMTTGENLASARFSYETLFRSPAFSLGIAASRFEYQLGDSARSLQAGGSAQQASAWGQYYFLRRLQANLKGRLQLDSFALRDRIEITDIKSSKRIHALTWELLGDRQNLGPGQSTNSLAVAWHGGKTVFENEQAALAESTAANMAGDYGFWTVKMQREQFLSPRVSWYAALSGQWANTNLDASQKFALGGPRSVRSYESGVLNGDTGQLLVFEWRYQSPMPAWWSSDNALQARLFWDYGQVRVNQKPLTASDETLAISGVGWALDWQGKNGWRATLSMAWPSANIPVNLANANATRAGAWFELRREY